MKVVCIMQARTGASRLPGKVLLPILGKPMFAHQLERDLWSRKLDAVVVATTDTSQDDELAELAVHSGVEIYRGSENDVLDRYYQAAKRTQADVVVRITGDCPLHYGDIIDETIEHFLAAKVDYARSRGDYPEGLDTEIFTFAALERAWHEAKLPSDREHVTPYLYTHPELFVCDSGEILAKRNSHGMHWSVDTPQDFTFITKIYEALYPHNPTFKKEDVFALLEEHPELLEINKDQTGYEGYAQSLEEDKKLLGNS